jgi:hypothetical protein
MLPTEEKTEKDQFFETLYGLDHFDDDEETEVETPVRSLTHKIMETSNVKPGKAVQKGTVKADRQRTDANLCDEGSQTAPVVLSDDEDVGGSQATNRALVKSQSSSISPPAANRGTSKRKPEVKGPPSPVRGPAKKKKVEVSRNVTDMSNIKQRMRQLPPKLRMPPVSLEKQVFKDLLFCTS